MIAVLFPSLRSSQVLLTVEHAAAAAVAVLLGNGKNRTRGGTKGRYFIELFMCLISQALTTVWASFLFLLLSVEGYNRQFAYPCCPWSDKDPVYGSRAYSPTR